MIKVQYNKLFKRNYSINRFDLGKTDILNIWKKYPNFTFPINVCLKPRFLDHVFWRPIKLESIELLNDGLMSISYLPEQNYFFYFSDLLNLEDIKQLTFFLYYSPGDDLPQKICQTYLSLNTLVHNLLSKRTVILTEDTLNASFALMLLKYLRLELLLPPGFNHRKETKDLFFTLQRYVFTVFLMTNFTPKIFSEEQFYHSLIALSDHSIHPGNDENRLLGKIYNHGAFNRILKSFSVYTIKKYYSDRHLNGEPDWLSLLPPSFDYQSIIQDIIIKQQRGGVLPSEL